MSGRYGFVARLRRQLQLYRVSKSPRSPFGYLLGRKSNPNKIRRRDQFDKNFIDEIQGSQSSVQSHQWSHSGALQEKWASLKNVWFKSRIPQISGVFQSNDITSDYLSQHLLSSMEDGEDENDHLHHLRSKWVKFTKRKLLRLGNASMNNKMEIYHRGELFFEQLWSDIACSEEQILMETYIMDPDAISTKTIQLLTEASLRGVSVVLIVDSFGSSSMNIESNPYLNELRRAGAVVLEYNKVKVPRFFEFIFLKFEIPFIFWYRNHKKNIIIDDTVGYTGGMNISGEYCGLQIGGSNKFRDTHVRLEGDIVRYLKESFYFSVLDMNPTVPSLNQMDEGEDTDIDTDIDSDAESEDMNELKESNDEKKVYFAGNDIHKLDDVEITELDPKRARREVMRSGEALPLRQRLFPTQMLPAFLKNFNSYRKRKKFENDQNHRNDDQPMYGRKDLSEIGLSEDEETILYGRRQRWRESWKQMQDAAKARNPWNGSSTNPVDETQRNRVKILASTPRKSLSEWMKYYEGRNRREEAEAMEGDRDIDIQSNEERSDPSLAMKPKSASMRSALEVSALSKLMTEAKQTNNFTYHYHMRKSHGMEEDPNLNQNGNGNADDSGNDEKNSLYLQVLESYRDKRFRLIQKALMNAIDNAESHVYIMNPYFLPPVKLKRKLRKASARGVEVRVITCDQSDVPFISMASRHIYEELLSNENIRLFEYEGDDSNDCANILHGKMCIIDNVFVSLGSFNWDDWSYTKNLEMNLMIVDDNVGKSVHDQFIVDQTKSKEIKLENVQNDRSIFQKCLYSAAYYIATIANRIT